jgi:hypothetical protein
MNTKTQIVCLYAIPAFILLYIAAFIGLSNFVPPPSPSLTGEELVVLFENNRFGIRAGQLLCMVFSILYMPWSAVISVQMARIEGRYPVLSCLQLVGAANLCVFFMICSLIWSIAAFRPDQSPQILQMLNDSAWLIFVMAYPGYLLQLVVMGIVFLRDDRHQPFLPRWFCFLTFTVAFFGIGGGFATFFKAGPFAFNGIFGFWVPVISYLIWLIIMFPLMLKGVKRDSLHD